MMRTDLLENRCACGASLAEATRFARKSILYEEGEFAGCRGVLVLASCECGSVTKVPYSVELGRAA